MNFFVQPGMYATCVHAHTSARLCGCVRPVSAATIDGTYRARPLWLRHPRPPPRALLNTDPHGRVLLRIIQRIILYYSSLSCRSKSSILTEIADVVSVSYLNVARLKLLFENIFIHLFYSSWVCQLFTSCRDSI